MLCMDQLITVHDLIWHRSTLGFPSTRHHNFTLAFIFSIKYDHHWALFIMCHRLGYDSTWRCPQGSTSMLIMENVAGTFSLRDTYNTITNIYRPVLTGRHDSRGREKEKMEDRKRRWRRRRAFNPQTEQSCRWAERASTRSSCLCSSGTRTSASDSLL